MPPNTPAAQQPVQQMPPAPPVNPPPPQPPPLHSNGMLEQGEQVLARMRRHPIGLVIIYLETFAGVAALLAIFFLVAPDSLRNLSGTGYTMLTIASILIIALVVLILMAVTSVYRQNTLLITTRSIIQTLQSGLFHRKTSRLAMADVEDVTVQQQGLIPTTFNYGTLHVETSGELKNFAFKYCPDPNKYASIVIQARQQSSRDANSH